MSASITVFPLANSVPSLGDIELLANTRVNEFLARCVVDAKCRVVISEPRTAENIVERHPLSSAQLQPGFRCNFGIDSRGVVAHCVFDKNTDDDVELLKLWKHRQMLGNLEEVFEAAFGRGANWTIHYSTAILEGPLVGATAASAIASLVNGVMMSDDVLPDDFGPMPATAADFYAHVLRPSAPKQVPGVSDRLYSNVLRAWALHLPRSK